MAVRAYIDGSDQAKDKTNLTLAGYAGAGRPWSGFESEWNATLSNYGVSYFHWREAIYGRGAFAVLPRSDVRKLCRELVSLMSRGDREDVVGFSCTIEMTGYREAQQRIPKLPHPTCICLDHCVGSTLRHSALTEEVELVLDSDESFARIFKEMERRQPWWSGHVLSIIDNRGMRNIPGMQAASLLAWLANRHFTKGEEDEWGMLFAPMLIATHLRHVRYDEKAIIGSFDQDGNYKEDAAIPAAPIRFPSDTMLHRRNR